MKFAEDLRRTMAIQNPVIEHNGLLNQDTILKILNNLEKLMDEFGEKLKTTRKAFTIITECLQNIVRYSDKIEDKDVNPLFILDKQDDRYLIATGNLVSKNKSEKLKDRLISLNSMDWYAIQEAYREVIKKNMLEKDPERDRNSAGLGFIEMARKSEQKFIFDFKEYDEDYDYFILGIPIAKNSERNKVVN
jgi:hypothetical protein